MNEPEKTASGFGAFDSATFGLTVRIALLVLLGYWTFNIVAPFLTVILWSLVLAVALYPMFDWLSQRINSPRLSAVVVTLVCLLVIIGPVTWLGLSLINGVITLVKNFESGALTIPLPLESIKSLPVIGEYIHRIWSLAASNITEALAEIIPQLRPVGERLIKFLGSLGFGAIEFIASIVVAGFLFIPGPRLVEGMTAFFRRALNQRGEDVVKLAGITIRNVSRGVVGVALLQSLLGGIGFLAAGIPGAGILTFVALVLSIIQVGPAVVFIPVTLWSWTLLDTTAAIIFTVYMVPVSLIDNILRPIVMARGLPIPMPVFFVGMLGGVVAYGIGGLFLGPIVLSVVWTLVVAWLREGPDGTP